MTLAMREIYMQHYIQQSCGWVKIAEYACRDEAQVETMKREIHERHPNDDVMYKIRGVTDGVRWRVLLTPTETLESIKE